MATVQNTKYSPTTRGHHRFLEKAVTRIEQGDLSLTIYQRLAISKYLHLSSLDSFQRKTHIIFEVVG
jgi:hypothetical protein